MPFAAWGPVPSGSEANGVKAPLPDIRKFHFTFGINVWLPSALYPFVFYIEDNGTAGRSRRALSVCVRRPDIRRGRHLQEAAVNH